MSRHPHRIIYVGPTGFALHNALKIYQKVRDCVPTLEMRVSRRLPADPPPTDDPQVIYLFRKTAAEIERMMAQPGISEFDYANIEEELDQAAVWLYPQHVSETYLPIAELAQKHGAIPIYNPVGVLAQRVFAGVQMYGIPTLDKLVLCRYAYELLKLVCSTELQDAIRVPMMEQAAKMSWALPFSKVQEIVAKADKIQGWMTPMELMWLTEEAAKSESVVEIGCWKGRSTYALASACTGNVWAVDHWQGGKDEPEHIRKEAAEKDLFTEFQSNTKDLHNIAPLIGPSREVAGWNCIALDADFIFIDAGHGYDDVVADIRAWLPKARRIIAGHDYDYPDVARAVADVLGDVERGPGSIWYKKIAQEGLANAAD